MKIILLSLVVSLPLLGAEPKVVSFDKLQHRGRLTYIPNQETPFTGKAVRFYPSGQRVWEENYNEGKLDGLQTIWYEGGQKKSEGNNKDGYPHGLWTQWYPNGQKLIEEKYKNGKLHGLVISYNEDGTEKVRYTFKDGERVKD